MQTERQVSVVFRHGRLAVRGCLLRLETTIAALGPSSTFNAGAMAPILPLASPGKASIGYGSADFLVTLPDALALASFALMGIRYVFDSASGSHCPM